MVTTGDFFGRMDSIGARRTENMTVEGIRERLFELQDEKYRDFQQGLIPTVEHKEFIGIRTPALRKLAKELYKAGELDDFFRDLPHKYFDENQLHAFAISEMKDFDECMNALEEFLLLWITGQPVIRCRPRYLRNIGKSSFPT